MFLKLGAVKWKFNSDKYNYPVLTVCLLSMVLQKELYAIALAGLSCFYLIKTRGKISTALPGKLAYLYFGFVGIISGFLYLGAEGHTPYSFVKHVFYFVYNFSFILLGIIIPKLRKTKRENVLSSLLLFFFLYSVIDLVKVAAALFSQPFNGLSEYRDLVGVGSIYPVLGLYLIMYYNDDIKMKNQSRWIHMMVFAMSSCIHFSRTYLGVFAILLIFTGILSNFSTLMKGFGIIAILLLLLSIISPDIISSVTEKFMHSLSEISADTQEWDWQSVNHNWRGYELHCEFIKFRNSGAIEQLFGGGFGTTLDVLGYAYLVTDESTIPFLHNGYGTMLMIWGIAGIVVYIFMILNLNSYARKSPFKRDRRFALGLSFSLLFASYVIGTILFSSDTSKWIFFLMLILNSASGINKPDDNVEALVCEN